MKRIIHYFDKIEPKLGDVIVFEDGTRKTVRRSISHTVSFTDGTKIDFWLKHFSYLERDEEKALEEAKKEFMSEGSEGEE